MELGEATALAGTFVMSLLFKVHSLPLDDRSDRAKAWWQAQDSRIPVRPALEEQRRHLGLFASRRQADRRRDRQTFLTISAMVDDDGRASCPALRDDRCGIYDSRPATCRTVPLHYSRPPSTLAAYLDRFAGTSGYRCDTGPEAPPILAGNHVVDAGIRAQRDEAVRLAQADRGWKAHLLARMDDARLAVAAGLPSYDDVLRNSDDGYASQVPMVVAWRVAEREGLMSSETLAFACRGQAALIRAEIAAGPPGDRLQELLGTLLVYEQELARLGAAARPLASQA
jgi:hypothetical protein